MHTTSSAPMGAATAASAESSEPPHSSLEQWAMVLYLGGATVDDIALGLGVDRESVRRALADAGLPSRHGARQVDALAIMREVRRPGTFSLREVAHRLGYAEDTVRHSIAALGMAEAVRRLFRLRRRVRPSAPVALRSLAGSTARVA